MVDSLYSTHLLFMLLLILPFFFISSFVVPVLTQFPRLGGSRLLIQCCIACHWITSTVLWMRWIRLWSWVAVWIWCHSSMQRRYTTFLSLYLSLSLSLSLSFSFFFAFSLSICVCLCACKVCFVRSLSAFGLIHPVNSIPFLPLLYTYLTSFVFVIAQTPLHTSASQHPKLFEPFTDFQPSQGVTLCTRSMALNQHLSLPDIMPWSCVVCLSVLSRHRLQSWNTMRQNQLVLSFHCLFVLSNPSTTLWYLPTFLHSLTFFTFLPTGVGKSSRLSVAICLSDSVSRVAQCFYGSSNDVRKTPAIRRQPVWWPD